MAKGGSKLVTGIISFLLGFLFAIIVEVAAVFGVYTFVMNSNINTVMAKLGIPNTDDRYVNTDKDNGGVSTLKELLGGIKGLVYENGEFALVGKSFDDISNLVPATQLLLNQVYKVTDEYLELDHELFESSPMSDLAQVLSDSIMNVKTAALMEKLGIEAVVGNEADLVVKSLITGAETDYVTIEGSGLKLPVLYDYYIKDEESGSYSRVDYGGMDRPVDGVGALPANLRGREELFLSDSGNITDGEKSFARYMLCYVPCKITANGVEEAEYSVGECTDEHDGKTYKFQIVEYGADTDFIAVRAETRLNEEEEYVTEYVLDYDAVYAALNADSTGASDRFTGYSYYEPYARQYYYTEYNTTSSKCELKTVNGKNYFRDSQDKMVQLDALTLTDIIVDPYAPLDSVLVTEVMGKDNKLAKIFGSTTLGPLLRGEGVDEIIDNLEVGDFLDNVSPDNKLMCYIAHRISNLRLNPDGTYSAVYDKDGDMECEVTVRLDTNGYIYDVKDGEGNLKPSVKVNDLVAMAENMPLTVLMDINVDEPIMVYLGYGVSGLKSEAGGDYSYVGEVTLEGESEPRKCYIATETNGEKEEVVSIWYLDGNGGRVSVKSTKVNKVSERVNGFADDLTINDVLKLEGSTNMLLNAIKDTKLNKLEDRVNELTVGELFSEEELEKSSMLRQLRNNKLTELSTAIDELLIQSIYASEVYRLPENSDPLEVVDFDPAYEYYILKIEDGPNGEKLPGVFESVGTLTQEQFDNRGNTVYYTKGAETGEGAKFKIVGFSADWLYYESDGAGAFNLTEINSAELPEGTAKDNAVGKLTKEQYDGRGETKYYTYGKAQGMWKLVLYRWYRETDGEGNVTEFNTEKAYTINNFNNMVNQCASNVYKATLGELQDAGLIAADIKGKTFKFTVGGVEKSAELETLTLEGLINIVLLMSS